MYKYIVLIYLFVEVQSRIIPDNNFGVEIPTKPKICKVVLLPIRIPMNKWRLRSYNNNKSDSIILMYSEYVPVKVCEFKCNEESEPNCKTHSTTELVKPFQTGVPEIDQFLPSPSIQN